jgi:glycosyltransferase involved in cell wall biosynthesis
MSKPEIPRFSVVIPCYNEAELIAATLESLNSQDITEKYEVIVVDNNCTDETIKIAQQYGAIIVSEERAGVCWARQAGTQAAKGKIIVSTDADTTFSPNWLSTIDKSFRKNNRLVAIGGPCRYVDGPWWGKVYTHFLFTGVHLFCFLTGHPFYITATNIAFRKSAWESYNVTSMQGGDELDLLHNLRKKGKIYFNNSNPTYTSGRRLKRGLFYSLFVTFLFYYLGAYYINKIIKRSVVGSAPAFRGESRLGNSLWFKIGLIPFFLAIVITLMAVASIRSFTTDNVQDTASAFRDAWKVLT